MVIYRSEDLPSWAQSRDLSSRRLPLRNRLAENLNNRLKNRGIRGTSSERLE